MDASSNRKQVLLICALLAAVTLAVFWQVASHDLISPDDRVFIIENSHVREGLTWSNFAWAFSGQGVTTDWHPLTLLSHMAVCELWGGNLKAHHLVSVAFHLANALLLFWVLYRMTGAAWPSGFVAAMFALHPLHVEPVAWIAAFNHVLSTFFWMLTLWAYLRYVEHRTAVRYLLTLFVFALGLMAKPMLVTLPFVLLLLDWWPLGRLRLGRESGSEDSKSGAPAGSLKPPSVLYLLAEKVPFLVLAIVPGLITLRNSQDVASLKTYSLGWRLAETMVAYGGYLWKSIWPTHLGFIYPIPADFPLWQVVAAAVVLGAISVLVVLAAKRRPYLAVGWLWYLGTLVPVIGLVTLKGTYANDRYTYIPLIGLLLMAAWGVTELAAKWPYRGFVLSGVAGLALAGSLCLTWRQLGYWKNDITLLEHDIEVTQNKYIAHNLLGFALCEQGRIEEGIAHYRQALQINPDYAGAHYNWGNALQMQGKSEEVMVQYSQALRIQPDFAEAHNNLGNLLYGQGKLDEAIAHYSQSLRIKPAYAEAHNNLALALQAQGKLDDAVAHYSQALRIQPDFADAWHNLGVAYLQQGKTREAKAAFQRAVTLAPNDAGAWAGFCLSCARLKETENAWEAFRHLEKLAPDKAQQLRPQLPAP